jgi:hypothetical protein
MKCEEMRERMNEISLEELREQAGDEAFAEHLGACPECREYYEKCVALCTALDGWKVPDPRKNIHAGVMTAVAGLERQEREKGPFGGFREAVAAVFGRRFRVPAFAAVAVILVLAFSVTLNVIQHNTIEGFDELVMAQGPDGAVPTAVAHAEATPAVRPVIDQVPVVVRDMLPWLNQGKPGAVPAPVIVILGIPPWLYPQQSPRFAEERFIPDSGSAEDKI